MLCGSFRLVDWIEQLDDAPQAVVRDYLVDMQEADYPCFRQREVGGTTQEDACGSTRGWSPRGTPSRRCARCATVAKSGIVHCGSAVAVAILPETAPLPPATLRAASLHEYFEQLALAELRQLEAELHLIDFPHQLIQYNQDTLTDNLIYRLRTGTYEEVADGVFAAEDARLDEHVVADTQVGPIVLESHAHIGPFAYLSGPAHLGCHTRVIEHAAIKDYVSIGHTAKIGGEVEASVIESYTNKQHHGFLGHSYLGSWINLGAGTCNSDLKNTYGEVKMEYGSRKVPTGMQFVGCIMGDYSKTAINTGHLHRQDDRRVQHALRFRHDERPQLRQLCEALRSGHRTAAGRDDLHAASDVRTTQGHAASPRHAIDSRHVRADPRRTATGWRSVAALDGPDVSSIPVTSRPRWNTIPSSCHSLPPTEPASSACRSNCIRPRPGKARRPCFGTCEELRRCRPSFITCTYGAGGSTRDQTLEIVGAGQKPVPVAGRFALDLCRFDGRPAARLPDPGGARRESTTSWPCAVIRLPARRSSAHRPAGCGSPTNWSP